MISQHQIARLIEAHEYRQLIERILSNGRCRSAMAKRMLTKSDAAPAASLGLSLQRLSEITYSPTELAGSLTRRLLSLQRDDGFFAEGNQTEASTLAATAVALRGLITFNAQQQWTHSVNRLSLNPTTDVLTAITAAINLGLAALANEYEKSHAPDTLAAGWAIALWQLGDVADFRRLISINDLLTALDESATDLVEDELSRYAHAMAA